MGVNGYKCAVTTYIILNFRYAVKGVAQTFYRRSFQMGQSTSTNYCMNCTNSLKQDMQLWYNNSERILFDRFLHKTCEGFLGIHTKII